MLGYGIRVPPGSRNVRDRDSSATRGGEVNAIKANTELLYELHIAAVHFGRSDPLSARDQDVDVRRHVCEFAIPQKYLVFASKRSF
ncbi:hypothetical protein GCM10010520_14850 [Rhizobium viscosum]